ncbi:MAG TPA: RsmE family RNA methyltransferase [Candidatus Acidoferrales bacterium]|nr:RsmE family RNA methyltransferase [Candidatus Acidoferrales bacterium]
MRRRFFVDRFDAGTALLRGDSAEHLGRVLRAEQGQLYELSDGERVWLAKVARVELAKRGESRIEFSLVEPLPVSAPRLRIDLLLSIVKFDRLEWCLEKATELGATNIVPLAAARTDKPLIAAAGKRRERWKRIVLESAQQSRRLKPPMLQEIARPEKAFAVSPAGLRMLLSELRDAPPLRQVLSHAHGTTAATLAIGPEGGWTDEELVSARRAKFVEASLGENILRTETAVVAAMAILNFAVGE